MIKKLLFTFAVGTSLAFTSLAQICIPNVSCIPAGTNYGICPDSATGLATGTVGVPYTQVMSMMVPPDGTDFGQPLATIVSIDIDSVAGLAPGLSYACAPAGCSFPGNSNGCIYIAGTPSVVWNQQITVYATGYATVFGFPASLPQTNQQYRSIVVAATGIETLDLNKFDVAQNSPNPFSESSEIRFSTVNNGTVDFKVFNMLGAVIFDSNYKTTKGVNTIKIDSNSFAPGVYIYSITNGDKTITKRMIVAGK